MITVVNVFWDKKTLGISIFGPQWLDATYCRTPAWMVTNAIRSKPQGRLQHRFSLWLIEIGNPQFIPFRLPSPLRHPIVDDNFEQLSSSRFPSLTPRVDSSMVVCVFVYKYRQLRKGELLSTLQVFAMVTISPLLRLSPHGKESFRPRNEKEDRKATFPMLPGWLRSMT